MLELAPKVKGVGKQDLKLNITKEPFWPAMVAISKGSGLGLENWGGMRLQLTSDWPPIGNYSLVGPGLMTAEWPAELEREGTQVPETGMAVSLYYDPWELMGPQIRNLVAVRGTETVPLELEHAAKAECRGFAEWVGISKTVDVDKIEAIRGELVCDIRKHFVPLSVKMERGRKVEREGIAIEATGDRADGNRHAFSFRITWETGLTAEERERLGRTRDRLLRGEKAGDQEQEWMTAVLARCRQLVVVEVVAYNANGDRITPFLWRMDSSRVGSFALETVGDEGRLRTATLDILCADGRNAVLPFEIRREASPPATSSRQTPRVAPTGQQ
jgi:hypothetical protein